MRQWAHGGHCPLAQAVLREISRQWTMATLVSKWITTTPEPALGTVCANAPMGKILIGAHWRKPPETSFPRPGVGWPRQ